MELHRLSSVYLSSTISRPRAGLSGRDLGIVRTLCKCIDSGFMLLGPVRISKTSETRHTYRYLGSLSTYRYSSFSMFVASRDNLVPAI